MKKGFKQVAFALSALALTLSMVACGADQEPTEITTTTQTTTTIADTTTTVSEDTVKTTASTKQNNTTTKTSGKSSTTTSATATSASTKAPAGGNMTWAQVKASMPASLKGTTVTIYNWNELSAITDAEKVVANFQKETGITVKWEAGNYQTYTTEITAKQTAGIAPDIVRMKEVDPARMRQLQPLANTGFDFSDAAWDQNLMKMYTYKGKAYAANLANTLMQQPNVYQYNKELISKYDLEDPFTLWKQGKWTWSKFMEICTQFQDDVGDEKNALSANLWADGIHMLGSDLVKYTDNGYVNNFKDPKVLQGMSMYIKMKDKGMINSKLYARQPFEAGNILFMHDSIIGARKTHFDNTQLKATGDLGIVPLPAIDGQNEYYQLFRELEAYGVPKGAKNVEAVPYFLRYFLDATNYNEKTFFYNQNTLEVYKHCMSQKNRVMTANYYSVFNSGETEATLLVWEMYNSTEAGLTTVVGENFGKADAAVKLANKILSELG